MEGEDEVMYIVQKSVWIPHDLYNYTFTFSKKKSGEPFGHTSRSSREEGGKDDFEVGYSFYFIHLHFARKKTNNEFLLHVSITKNTTCLGFGQSLLLPFSKGNAWL